MSNKLFKFDNRLSKRALLRGLNEAHYELETMTMLSALLRDLLYRSLSGDLSDQEAKRLREEIDDNKDIFAQVTGITSDRSRVSPDQPSEENK